MRNHVYSPDNISTEVVCNKHWLSWLRPIHIPDPTRQRSILKFKAEAIFQTYPSSMIFYFSEIPTRRSGKESRNPMQIGIHFDFNMAQVTAQHMAGIDFITRPMVINDQEQFVDPVVQALFQRVPGLINSIGNLEDDHIGQIRIEQARRFISCFFKEQSPSCDNRQIH